MSLAHARSVYGASPDRDAARSLMNGGRAVRNAPRTLVPAIAPQHTHPATHTFAASPVRQLVPSHLVGASAQTLGSGTCVCACHYSDTDCSPLPGASRSYASCAVTPR